MGRDSAPYLTRLYKSSSVLHKSQPCIWYFIFLFNNYLKACSRSTCLPQWKSKVVQGAPTSRRQAIAPHLPYTLKPGLSSSRAASSATGLPLQGHVMLEAPAQRHFHFSKTAFITSRCRGKTVVNTTHRFHVQAAKPGDIAARSWGGGIRRCRAGRRELRLGPKKKNKQTKRAKQNEQNKTSKQNKETRTKRKQKTKRKHEHRKEKHETMNNTNERKEWTTQ